MEILKRLKERSTRVLVSWPRANYTKPKTRTRYRRYSMIEIEIEQMIYSIWKQ